MRLCLVLACLGCSTGSDCAQLGPASGAAAQASTLRLDVYPDSARCSGGAVAAGSSPVRSTTFARGADLRLDLPPGSYVVHLAAYADSGATQLLGEGCSVVVIRAGEASCLALAVSSVVPDGCAPFTHSNGLGQTYSDCAPLGTHDARVAGEACAAFSNDPLQCKDSGCSGGNTGRAVCVSGGGGCACWVWSGPTAGHVHQSLSGSCSCGSTSDPTWD